VDGFLFPPFTIHLFLWSDAAYMMNGIYVISRESYIKARIIKIRTKETLHIEEAIKLAHNGFSAELSSHSETPDGFQMFLHENADGESICRKIFDALSRLPSGNTIVERINC